MNESSQETVIVGAGFAGLFTALHLRHRKYSPSIILIEPQDRFVFKPMLFERLTDELDQDTVCPSYEELLQGSEIVLIKDHVVGLDLKQNQITLASGKKHSYSYLVLAVGSIQGYRGTQGAPENVFPFRTQDNMLILKKHLQDCLQQASQSKNEQYRKALLTFTIVGAGPSGVEMAATLADLLPHWYAKLGGNIHEIRLILVNHGQSILGGDINEHLQHVALDAFRKRIIPVELLLGVSVKSVWKDALDYQASHSEQVESIHTHTTIWTAGTANNSLIEMLKDQIAPENLNKHGLPIVSSTLQLLDFPNVFGAGDCVEVKGNKQPAIAQVAYQQGADIAHNLIAISSGKKLRSSDVKLRGTLMKLGLGNGVANLFDKVQIEGKPGDLIRNVTYLEMLPTPLHNFKATVDWLKNETFYHYSRKDLADQLEKDVKPQMTPVQKKNYAIVKGLSIIAPIVFIVATYIALKTPPREKIRIDQTKANPSLIKKMP